MEKIIKKIDAEEEYNDFFQALELLEKENDEGTRLMVITGIIADFSSIMVKLHYYINPPINFSVIQLHKPEKIEYLDDIIDPRY